jgi:energy-coupling factor transporter ATP-binding protein EcfA2
MSMFAAASGRVAVASSALVASSRQPPSRPWAPSRARRSSILASLEDTAESAPRSLPSASGPFAVDLSALTPDERAWLRARDELKVLVLGKTGVGKSSLVNAIAHADSAIGALEVGTTQVYDVRSALLSTEDGATHDFALFDTPGFFDVEGRTPAGVLRELSGKVSEFHAVVYAHVATDKRTRLEDEQSVSFITRALGPAAARRAIVALTFANEVRGNTEEERAMVIKTRGEQARGLFADAAAQVAGGTDSGLKNAPETEAPYVACGQAGDDTQWEGELWRAVIRRAKAAADFEKAPVSDAFDATAAELEVDWEGLRLAGVSLEGAPPRPPPPLELVKKYVATALGEFASRDGKKKRSCFAVKQRGMPSGFAATVLLEVFGDVDDASRDVTNAVYLLMPGAEPNAVMKVRMGRVPLDELPGAAALRRGGAEVTVGALAVGGSAPETLRHDASDGSFATATERLSASGIVEIDPDTGEAVVMARKTPAPEAI